MARTSPDRAYLTANNANSPVISQKADCVCLPEISGTIMAAEICRWLKEKYRNLSSQTVLILTKSEDAKISAGQLLRLVLQLLIILSLLSGSLWSK